jgi:hypothetical protein
LSQGLFEVLVLKLDAGQPDNTKAEALARLADLEKGQGSVVLLVLQELRGHLGDQSFVGWIGQRGSLPLPQGVGGVIIVEVTFAGGEVGKGVGLAGRTSCKGGDTSPGRRPPTTAGERWGASSSPAATSRPARKPE